MKLEEKDHSAILSPSRLRVHNDSHLITKIAPKIRIIHIQSPKIIKTDEANFQELVQSLTGKHAHRSRTSSSSTKNTTNCQPKASSRSQSRKIVQSERRVTIQDSADHHNSGVWKESNIQVVTPMNRTTVSVSDLIQLTCGIPIFQKEEKVKKEFMMGDHHAYKWNNGYENLDNNGLLMGGLSDMGNLFQDPSEFNPLLLSVYSQINFLGGMPWSLSQENQSS